MIVLINLFLMKLFHFLLPLKVVKIYLCLIIYSEICLLGSKFYAKCDISTYSFFSHREQIHYSSIWYQSSPFFYILGIEFPWKELFQMFSYVNWLWVQLFKSAILYFLLIKFSCMTYAISHTVLCFIA